MIKWGSSSTNVDSDSGVKQESDLKLEAASDEGVENGILCGRRSNPGRDPKIAKIQNASFNFPWQSWRLWTRTKYSHPKACPCPYYGTKKGSIQLANAMYMTKVGGGCDRVEDKLPRLHRKWSELLCEWLAGVTLTCMSPCGCYVFVKGIVDSQLPVDFRRQVGTSWGIIVTVWRCCYRHGLTPPFRFRFWSIEQLELTL